MFHFPGFAPQKEVTHNVPGFPIRTSTDQRLLAANRSFSQLATSFIAVHRQGILHILLVA